MFRPALSNRILPLAVIAGLFLSSAARPDDAAVTAPEPEPSGGMDAGVGQSTPGAMSGGIGALELLQEASTFLDHDQMVRLTHLLAEQRAQMRQHRVGARPRSGGRGRAGHHGQMPGHLHGQRRGGMRGQIQGQMQGPKVLEWADELELSDEQRAAVLEHHEAMRPTMQQLRGESGTPPGEMNRAKMRELQAANRAWLEGVLTEAQLDELDELRNERRAARRGANAERRELRATARLDALDQILDLSDRQREAIEKIMADQKQQVDALRDDTQRGPGPPDTQAREARAKEFEAIGVSTRDRISGTLTEEQRELFDALQELSVPGPRGPRARGGRGPGGD